MIGRKGLTSAGVVTIAAVLAALLIVVVVDSISSRRDADDRTDKTIAELERRGERIGELNRQVAQLNTDRADLAEEVRALRELLIDSGMLEPRPSAGSAPRPAPSPQAAPKPRSSPKPRPTAKPKPSSKPKPSPKPSPSPSCTVRNPITGTCLIQPKGAR